MAADQNSFAMGTAAVKDIVSSDYNVCEAGPRLTSAYSDAPVRVAAFAHGVPRCSKSVWSSRLGLYPESFFDVDLPVPRPEEERVVVEHVARETARIDAVPAATEPTIALLKEQGFKLIVAAVTRQLDVGAAA